MDKEDIDLENSLDKSKTVSSIKVGDIIGISKDSIYYPSYKFGYSYFPYLSLVDSFSRESASVNNMYRNLVFIVKYIGNGQVMEMASGLIMNFRVDNTSENIESGLCTANGDTIFSDGVYPYLPSVSVKHTLSDDPIIGATERKDKYIEFLEEHNKYVDFYSSNPLSIIADSVYQVDEHFMDAHLYTADSVRVSVLSALFQDAKKSLNDINGLIHTNPSRELMGSIYTDLIDKAYLENDIYNFKKELVPTSCDKRFFKIIINTK